jgi:glutaconate CoA-transferase, subunit B
VILKQSPRTFVERLDFRTSVGFGDGPGSRAQLGMRGRGVTAVITDLGELEPDPETCELTLARIHPGVTVEQAVAATAWPLAVRDDLAESIPPSERELEALRALRAAGEREPAG